MFDTVLLSLGG